MGETKNTPLVEHVFRHEYGKIISFLVHKFGPSHLEQIEDAVQEALIKAMQVWGYNETPQNPSAWLLRVANNQLIDTLRKDKRMVTGEVDKLHDNIQQFQQEVSLKGTINDSQLKMIFACCHPSLSQEYQIILSLKLIGGFGNAEISKALIKKEETVAKSFTRAKKKLKDNVASLDIPVELGLKSRLNIVLKIIYLLFTEGYAASSGANLIKKDICLEAIRLALLLSGNKYCKTAEVHALIALMCFHASRFEARIDLNGDLVDLEHQDRKLYDRELIKKGISHLELAAVKEEPSDYHIQAAISYYHCVAKRFSETDWQGILKLYDLQLRQQYSPIVQLNRIVPFHRVYGADRALVELLNYKQGPHFKDSALYYAIQAELLTDQQNYKGAMAALKKAVVLTSNEMEKKHFYKKLANLQATRP